MHSKLKTTDLNFGEPTVGPADKPALLFGHGTIRVKSAVIDLNSEAEARQNLF